MKHISWCRRKNWQRVPFTIIVLVLLSTGCAGGGKPSYNVEKYLLNYAAPSYEKPVELAASIKFNRFSIDAAYNTSNMIFSQDAYSIDAFNYSRWAVNPADMVADNLLRDLRQSGLFQTVFSRHELDDGRFVVSGGIETFYLRMDKNNKTAVVSLVISLKDNREKETGKRMLLQKKYVREELLQDPSPRGYCQAVSQAMQKISRAIISDIYAAVKAAAP